MRSTGRPGYVAALGGLRVAVGLGLSIAPRRTGARDDSGVLLARTVGIRDIALGLGTAVAARSGTQADSRRWVGIGLLSDIGDVVAGLASARRGSRSALVAALIPVPVIAADLWLLMPTRDSGPSGASR